MYVIAKVVDTSVFIIYGEVISHIDEKANKKTPRLHTDEANAIRTAKGVYCHLLEEG